MRNDITKRPFWLPLFILLLLQVNITTAQSPTPTSDPPPATRHPLPANPFGVVESYEDPTKAGSLGVGWTRLRFQWADVQAGGPESWTPPLTDEEIDAEIAAGREVVGLLIGIPDWARDAADLPAGLTLPPDDPGNTWAAFVREVVGRYEGRIDHWIIWNEPDIADPDALGHTWDGSLDDFIQLLRVAYLTAKETNPGAVIHLPAITYYWDPAYLDQFFDALIADPEAAAHDYYFDAATAHLYFQPDAVYTLIRRFDEAMVERGIVGKPVWLVETNAPPMDDPYWKVDEWTLAVTLNEQAAFMPQAIVSALAAGAERIAVYKLKDTPGDKAANPEPFGLVRRDGSRRPAFDTYRVAIRQLADAVFVERERWDAVGQFRVYRPAQTTTVLFARLPQPQTARVAAIAERARLVDMWGQRQEDLLAKGGFFTVELPGAFCSQTIGDYCMIGSTTYYIIQDVAAALPTATPPTLSPTPSPTSSPTASPSATTTPTATSSPTTAPTFTATPSPTATAPPSAAPPPTATVPPAAVPPPPAAPAAVWWAVGGLALLAAGFVAWRQTR